MIKTVGQEHNAKVFYRKPDHAKNLIAREAVLQSGLRKKYKAFYKNKTP